MWREIAARAISLVALALLWLIGWAPLPDVTHLLRHERVVATFSHSSYWDFAIVTLYRLAYPRTMGHVYTLMKPQYFTHFGFILRGFGFIPSTRLEEKNGGAVDRVVQELQGKPCIFCISPKGTIVQAPWRSGYYAIAQGLKCPIITSGMDYEKRAIIMNKNFYFTDTERHVMEPILQTEFADIVPCHPHQEIPVTRSYNASKLGPINWIRVLSVFALTMGLQVVWS
jgi:1-acyl-sn-glycerol-3-phosphate acyltransferase